MNTQTINKNLVWKGKPSQVIYLHIHLLNLIIVFALTYFSKQITEFMPFVKPLYLFVLILLILLRSAYLIVKISCTHYTVFTNKIGFKRGIFNLKYDETEMYRIKDYTLFTPFFLRIFSLSNLKMVSSDRLFPVIELNAIPNGFWLFQEIQKNVEIIRKKTGTREFD